MSAGGPADRVPCRVAFLAPSLELAVPAIALGAIGGIVGIASEDLALILVLIIQSVLQLLAYPFFYVLTTLFYYDLRIRKEAYDLEMLASGLNPA